MAIALTIADVDKSSLLQRGTLNISWMLGARGMATFELKDPTGAYRPEVGVGCGVYVDGSRIWSGMLIEVSEIRYDRVSGITLRCSAVTLEQRLEKRLIRPPTIPEDPESTYKNQTAGAIVADIMAHWGAGENILIPPAGGSIGAGATIDKIIFDHVRVSDALTQLAEASNYVWYVGADNGLYFIPKNTFIAPFAITDGVNIRDIEITRTLTEFRSGELIRISWSAFTPTEETFQGDGATKYFYLDFPAAQIERILVDDVEQTWGVANVDGGVAWYWEPGTKAIMQDEGTPSITGTLKVIYRRLGSDVVSVYDNAVIAARQAAEGSSGRYEHMIEDAAVTDEAAALARITALLGQKKTIPASIRVITDTGGLLPGQTLSVNMAAPTIVDAFLVSEVEAEDVDGEFLRYSATANNASLDTWLTTWEKIAGKQTGGGIGGGAVNPTVPEAGGSVAPPAPATLVVGFDTGVRALDGTESYLNAWIQVTVDHGADTDTLHWWVSYDDGANWHEGGPETATGLKSTFHFWKPAPKATSDWKVKVITNATGAWADPATAVVSDSFTVAGQGACAADDITAITIRSITRGSNGKDDWISHFLDWTNPTAAKDPNFWFTRTTIQTVDEDGNPGGMWAEELVNAEEDGYGRVIARNNATWKIPTGKYYLIRFRVYACSQKTKQATLQTAVSWNSGAPSDHYDWNPTAAASEAPTSGNLIVNPGFEADGAGWSYTGAVTFVEGGRSGKCAQVAPSGVGNYQQITQEWIPCKPGEALQLSMWAKALAATNGTASGLLRFYNADRSAFNDVSTFSYVNAQTNWTQYTASAIVPADRYWALAYVIYVANGTSGGWLIDDVSLTKRVQLDDFPNSFRPVAIVAALPTLPDAQYPNGCAVVLSTDWKLYRNANGTWKKSVGLGDYEANSITSGIVQAGAVLASQVGSGTFPVGVVYGGVVYANQLQAGTIDVSWGGITFSGTGGITMSNGGNFYTANGNITTANGAVSGKTVSASTGPYYVGGTSGKTATIRTPSWSLSVPSKPATDSNANLKTAVDAIIDYLNSKTNAAFGFTGGILTST